MLFVASERGGAKQLAQHLLNDRDNDHVTVHEVRGFVSEDVTGAFKEAQAVAQGTRCKNFLFSVSLNPPEDKDVPVNVFEDTLMRIERKTGLADQPRVVVFHEKNGRRHAHCVWSRIDAETMTAKNLSHYKAKLLDISRDLYLEHDWKMPPGLTKSAERDPRNFSLAEWQQCKRMGKDARDVKTAIQDAWAISDNAATFAHALRERGFVLAKGDRRGHVAITLEGEVLSIARYADKKAKDVRARLGDNAELPSVDEARVQIAKDMRGAFARHTQEAKAQQEQERQQHEARRTALTAQHREERRRLEEGQKNRWEQEARQRSERINSGLRGLWQRMTGQRATIQQQNEREAHAALLRDREQRDRLVFQQMEDRRALQADIRAAREQHLATLREVASDQKRYHAMERQPSTPLQKDFETARQEPEARSQPVQKQAPQISPGHQERLDRLRQGRSPQSPVRQRGPDLER